MPTDIIKRRIGVYPQTWEQRKRWEAAAEKQGMPLSKFLVYVIDKTLQESQNQETESIADLKLDASKKAEELNEVKRELARMKKLITIQDNELEDYRNKAFVEKSFTGIRTYNRQLIDSLRKAGKPLTNDELLHLVGIPLTDVERIKSISTQLESLLALGIVQFSPKGWRWVS